MKVSKTIFATEVTEITEGVSARFFLCALCDLCGKVFSNKNFMAALQPFAL
jgi:hypothetical protein